MLVPMRPSSEHILIVRAPGARNQHGCHSIPFIVGALRARRAPGHSPLHSKLRSLSPQGWGLSDLPLRASNEGSPRPRVARARRSSVSIPSSVPRAGGGTGCPPLPIYCAVPLAPTSHGLCCSSLYSASPLISIPIAYQCKHLIILKY